MIPALLGFLVGVFGTATIVLVFVFWHYERFEKIVGRIFTGVAYVVRKVDKTAIAMRVQGEVNSLQVAMQKDSPEMIDKKLKIEWTDAEEAEARVRGGDVIVFMRDSRRHEENLANALMAFLPKALISRARRYVEADTMHAVDLTVAKTLLSQDDATEGALDAFYDRHLDPARKGSDRIKQKIGELDMIDLHGWLSRILLAEYRRVGDELHPAEPDEDCLREAERLAEWLYRLAVRKKDTYDEPLTFPGEYFKVALIFVADWTVLTQRGTDPYRKRAVRHLYGDNYDSVYLLARDPNLGAVDEVVEALGADGTVAMKSRHVYPLRRDFQARIKLRREVGICVCLRRGEVDPPPEISVENATDEGQGSPATETDAAAAS